MSAQARTAGEWTHRENPSSTFGNHLIEAPSGEGINETVATQVNPANAAFIVKACNAHDELVAALNRLLFCPALNLDDLEEEDLAAADQARAALRKVSS